MIPCKSVKLSVKLSVMLSVMLSVQLFVMLPVMLSVQLSVMAISLSLRNQITDSITKNVMCNYEPTYTCTPSWLLLYMYHRTNVGVVCTSSMTNMMCVYSSSTCDQSCVSLTVLHWYL